MIRLSVRYTWVPNALWFYRGWMSSIFETPSGWCRACGSREADAGGGVRCRFGVGHVLVSPATVGGVCFLWKLPFPETGRLEHCHKESIHDKLGIEKQYRKGCNVQSQTHVPLAELLGWRNCPVRSDLIYICMSTICRIRELMGSCIGRVKPILFETSCLCTAPVCARK